MNLTDILVYLQVYGCQILRYDKETEAIQEVEFKIGQSTDYYKLIKMLRRNEFYDIRIDSKQEDVIIATRFVYTEESNLLIN